MSIRWHVLFKDLPSLTVLKQAVANGDDSSPCITSLRSIFLLFGDLDPSNWQKTLSDSRSAYSALREHFLHAIEHPELIQSTDPLADDHNSPWITLRQDELLRAEIQQDVERCMPENAYFRDRSTQRQLLDVLFIFCKLSPDIGYRQGMHEVLAPILWVVEQDAIEPSSLRKHRGSDGSDGLLRDLLHVEYVEHDVFTLFSLVMQTARTFYEPGDPDHEGNPVQAESPIIQRSQRIHLVYLASVDPELAERMAAIDVLPQIFLVRWIRLLFGREFSLDQLLRLWDLLFAEDPSLELVDLVCVAMLLRVRWQLVHADYSSGLSLLLRYPTASSPCHAVSFAQDALYLRDHLTLAGGAHLIAKYSGKAPKARPQHEPSSGMFFKSHAPAASTPEPAKIRARTQASPARSFRRPAVDVLLHDAARAVYRRGEQWGVNRAVRDAMDEVKRNVQGLQSVASTPHRAMDAVRWSLDEGRHVAARSSESAAKAVEQRAQVLAQILAGALQDLAVCQTSSGDNEGGAPTVASALERAVTKVRVVQACLADASLGLPLTVEALAHDDDDDASTTTATAAPPRAPSPPPATSRALTTAPVPTPAPPHPTLTPSKASATTAAASPRPALAESSFAWMLGEHDHSRASFQHASFPTPGTLRQQSKDGGARKAFLFGTVPATTAAEETLPARREERRQPPQDRERGRERQGEEEGREEEQEGFFSLSSLSPVRPRAG
ncbi:MAG: hypothetical protein M1826_007447 [Phylliscum demangeonii]|nr:MAG: hypothetical protein M1826_007447 [Phylliscum demangeonii]